MNRSFYLLIASSLLMFIGLTCSGDDPLTPPDPSPFDPTRPTIDSFIAQRDGITVEDNIVFSGEDIDLVVQATSHAWPVSCGLTEEDTVEGNLLYAFQANPPEGVTEPGHISQATPPSNRAIWRIPDLTAYDTGHGVLYALTVTVYDECLGNQSIGSLTLRAFADQGPPILTETSVESAINTGSPVTEILDQNNYYEVEQSDTCRIAITAQSRTSDEICSNNGVQAGEKLRYEWSSTADVINLSYDEDENKATAVEFDIPITISVGDTFQIKCDIIDECTGTMTPATFMFIVVGAPEISGITGTANGLPLTYDLYFDVYEVFQGDEIILTALGGVMDNGLCVMKGIYPDIEWLWEELGGAIPSIVPEFDPLPEPNGECPVEFVIPAASNGTEYSFQCTATDRCNGLIDIEQVDLLVIIPPHAEITLVRRDSTDVLLSPESGRYEVYPGDLLTVRITGTASSDTSFCEVRGVSQSPPIQYYWGNQWESLILNYDPLPEENYCDLLLVIPEYTPPMEVDMTCRVTDICNELTTDVVVPFEVLELEED